jgi:hypothetical protein
MVITLCATCAHSFYDSNDYKIRRENEFETVKESCHICRVRMGFDFIVRRRKGARKWDR